MNDLIKAIGENWKPHPNIQCLATSRTEQLGHNFPF